MAHLIDMTTAAPAIAYRGETPWHGLGFPMQGDESLDEWRIRAKLDWTAEKVRAKFQVPGEDAPRDAENCNVLYRSDTHGFLSTVSDRYKVVQPREVIEFYRDLCDSHGFTMETCGAIRDGKVVWALAKTGDTTRVRGNDVVNGYLLLGTSYDGSAATTARFTTVRVVCNNTLTQAVNGAKAAVSIPHSSFFDADAAKIKLGVGNFADFAENARRLAETPITNAQAIDFFLDLYHDTTMAAVAAMKAEGEKARQIDKTIARLGAIFNAGPGADLKSAKGTAWGLLNAVTYDQDHVAGRTQDRRLSSAWFGDGANMKAEAFGKVLALAA
jgi:phage/plasmid-like protein (TIGR03299 family)